MFKLHAEVGKTYMGEGQERDYRDFAGWSASWSVGMLGMGLGLSGEAWRTVSSLTLTYTNEIGHVCSNDWTGG